MKLLTFTDDASQTPRLGISTAQGVIDLAATGAANIPTTMDALLQAGSDGLAALQAWFAALTITDDERWLLDEDRLTYGPCVTNPEKIICIGLNYKRHARESGLAVPEVPVLFSKFNNALAGAKDDIPLPANATQYDYEVELGAVIGKTARYVDADQALDYVLGYCTLNDLSVRDLQSRTSQWLLGKTLDRFLPTGPYLVSADEIPDPQNLPLRCWVNGDLRQESNTSDMVFTVAQCVSYISQYLTLKPGDVISTGTPEGVILGRAEKDWLVPGDEVVVEVEKLDQCANRMVQEGG
jgi:2-keto-4-pentenoate hydratase/2-oxohepta-3-ene-1,7-dioic acid hydratase in catechol pathway